MDSTKLKKYISTKKLIAQVLKKVLNIKKGQQQQSKKQTKYRQRHYESKYLEADNQVRIPKSVIQLQKLQKQERISGIRKASMSKTLQRSRTHKQNMRIN